MIKFLRFLLTISLSSAAVITFGCFLLHLSQNQTTQGIMWLFSTILNVLLLAMIRSDMEEDDKRKDED